MTEPIELAYTIRRGDAWTGDDLSFNSEEGLAFWDNYDIWCQLRAAPNGPVAHEFVFTPQVVLEGGLGKLKVTLALTPEETAKLNPGPYVADIKLSSDTLPTSTLVNITLTVVPNVTRGPRTP